MAQAKALENTTDSLGKIEAAKVALQAYDFKKKAAVVNKKAQLDLTEIGHLN